VRQQDQEKNTLCIFREFARVLPPKHTQYGIEFSGLVPGKNKELMAIGEAAANITAEYFTKNLLLVFLSVPSRVILAVAGLPILATWFNKSIAIATICQAAAYPPSTAVPLKDFNTS